MANHARARDGKYDYSDMGLMCRCGHKLGVHLAEGPRHCLNSEVGTGESCDCERFRRAPKQFGGVEEGMTAAKLREIFGRNLPADRAKELLTVLKRPLSGPTVVDKVLKDANAILDAHGVEAIRHPRGVHNGFYGDVIALYVNMGDAYVATVLYDIEAQELSVTSYGDWVEAWEREHEEESSEDAEPSEDDLTTEDHLTFYQNGKRVLTIGEDDDMWAALDAYMKKTNWYPNVWFISDHGNAHLMVRE